MKVKKKKKPGIIVTLKRLIRQGMRKSIQSCNARVVNHKRMDKQYYEEVEVSAMFIPN